MKNDLRMLKKSNFMIVMFLNQCFRNILGYTEITELHFKRRLLKSFHPFIVL